MLGKFFNSMYYGKAGKGDYTPEDMPTNRVQLFFEVLRVRWSALIRLNLLYILFWLPAIVWVFINIMTMQNMGTMVMDGAMTDAEFSTQLSGMVTAFLLILWPCIAITGPATAGVSYVTRNWARDQHSFMMSDFKDAFKANWKQALVISTITGVLPLVMYVCYQFYGGMASTNGVLFIIPQMLVLIIGLMWMLALELIYTMMITYELPLGTLIKNSLILSVGRLPMSIGIRLVTWAVPLLCLAVVLIFVGTDMYVLLFLALFYILIGFTLSRLITSSYANAVFDRFINPRIEGAPVNMGLRQTTDDDYEIDPTLPQPKLEDEDDTRA